MRGKWTEKARPNITGWLVILRTVWCFPCRDAYLIYEPHPDAFDTGRDPENATMSATTGLLSRLTPEEAPSLMDHDLGHVKNLDTLIMTMVATIAGAISKLAHLRLFFRGGNQAYGHGDIVATLLAVIVAAFAAVIEQMDISRTRDYRDLQRRSRRININPRSLRSKRSTMISGNVKMIPNRVAERIQ